MVGGQAAGVVEMGRAVVGVVDAAGDEGPVGVAVEELDDHLLADAG